MQAAADAGYENGKGLPKDRTSVIVGSCLTNEYHSNLQITKLIPQYVHYLEQVDEYNKLNEEEKAVFIENFKQGLAMGYTPKLPDGAALNVEASRIVKHLDVRGNNFVVDAACATSFAALDSGVKELLSGDSDVVFIGGVNTNLSPEAFVGFCKMGALSAEGSYPFDERAGGFVLGEGAGVVVIKRMKDAIADGNNILAVIKGIGASSDGKGKFIAAPSADGQRYALKRAYENMRRPFDPDDIDFIEAHGTSTIQGDATEIEVLQSFYNGKRDKGISSAKALVGHLLGGAGNAGLIKAVMAMKHKTLPSNGLFEKLSPKFKLDGSPLYIITENKEWKVEEGRKRRAAVSSYGFGGINYHILIEEYDRDYKPLTRTIFDDPSWDFNDDRIVVAGIGSIMPGVNSKDELWNTLETGKVIIGEKGNARFHNESFDKETDPLYHLPMMRMGIAKDYKFNGIKYKIPPMAQKVIDRAQLFSLDAAGQVIEDAGLKDIMTNGNKVSVIFGTATSEKNGEHIMRTRIPFLLDIISKIPVNEESRKAIMAGMEAVMKENYHKNTEDSIPGLLANITTGRVANFYNANGANFIVDAECAASAVAIGTAIKDLKAGTSDFIITGGVDTNLTPVIIMAFYMLKIISDKDQPRTYDSSSSGLMMSEGAALMCLTTYRKAKERNMKIYGEIEGMAFKSFPQENMISPTEPGFLRTYRDYYSRYNVPRRQVNYIDGFASSHRTVDGWELKALNQTYRNGTFLGNSKTELGYYRGANPALVISKLMLMAKNRTLLKSHSYSAETSMLNDESNMKAVTSEIKLKSSDSLYMGANFSGMGGIHGHAIVRTLPLWMEAAAAEPVPAGTTVQQMTPKSVAAPAAAKGGRICALLSGQGAQSSGMMKALYDSSVEIRKMMDRGEEIFRAERGYSILEMMFGSNDALNSTENTQVAIFISSASIFSVLKSKGFAPDFFIGHSIGEYSALYCAGILSFDDALKLIIKRSAIMKQTSTETGGAIMVVFQDADSVNALIERSGVKDVWAVNKNSDKQTAVSGTPAGIDALLAFLTAEKISAKKLNLSGAFHSPLFAAATEKMKPNLAALSFNAVDYSRIISNTTAKPYPSNADEIKALLAKQISSPVEFVNSVKYVVSQGVDLFVEVGPSRLLSNLLKDIPAGGAEVLPAVEPKKGEVESFAQCISTLEGRSALSKEAPAVAKKADVIIPEVQAAAPAAYVRSSDFNEFLERNREQIQKKLYDEYQKHIQERENEYFRRAGFYGGPVVISGVSIGIPGKMNRVFEDDNFDRVLSGMNLIEPISDIVKQKMVDMNIVKVHKDPQGNAKFLQINSTEDVLQLAGQLGYFDEKEYGIDIDYDISYNLAMAAGLEALKDAKIPLVPHIETTSVGSALSKGYALPAEMQENTGVIFVQCFQSLNTLVDEFERHAGAEFYRCVYTELENIYQYIMANVQQDNVKRDMTNWMMKVKEYAGEDRGYKFDRNFLHNILGNANAHFAQMIRARGANTQVNSACSTTTQAVGVAEDWIRTGRCERVIIIGAENSTTPLLFPFIGGGFLALGAASVQKIVSEAALPFDARRNGLIVGAAAVGIVIERQDMVQRRGFNGQAEILGVLIKNSAFHGTRLDVKHIASEMKNFVDRVEYIHDLKKEEYIPKFVFMSHETYTPARGGSADAEVMSLKTAFPDVYRKIHITNTKGFTGHTMASGIEDCVMVKGLQKGVFPPIANLKQIPENFSDLKFSKGEKGDFRYSMHFAAGFGSQFAMLFIRRIDENSADGNDTFKKWIKEVSGVKDPQLTIVNKTLTVKGEIAAAPAKKAEAPVPAATAPAAKTVAAPAPVAAAPAATGASVMGDIKKIIADMTGYSIDMLDENLDLEADLGIDTVKQVEIFGKVCDNYSIPVPEDIKLTELNTIAKLAGFIAGRAGVSAVSTEAPAAAPAASGASVMGDIKNIIADMTGYGVDMLDENLDLEADLGIDTVKQVEIFGKVCDNYSIPVPEDIKLTELNTIAKLAGFIAGNTSTGSVTATVSAPVAAAPQAAAVSGASVMGDIKKNHRRHDRLRRGDAG